MYEFEKATYRPFPSLAPYSKKDRYERPKEVFKQAVEKLKTAIDTKRKIDLVDIGCANGEFLYFAKKNFPHWNFTGFDFTKEFIDTAMSFEGLSGVNFVVKNLFDIEGEFDIVCCFGTLQIFPEIEKILTKLLSICRKGGVVMGNGLFNKFDVEVQTIFCDNSKPETKDIWRKDFSQHSRSRIKDFLKDKVKKVEFEDIIMGVEIPYNSGNPHVNAFTFRDANGRIIITSGINLVLNSTLMTIHK